MKGNRVLTFLECHLARSGDTNKLRNISRNGRGLEWNTIHTRVMTSVSNQHDVELNVVIRTDLVNYVEILRLRDITKTAIRERIYQRMFNSYAVDVI